MAPPLFVRPTTNLYQWPTTIRFVPRMVSVNPPVAVLNCSRTDQLVAVTGLKRNDSNATLALLFRPLTFVLRKPNCARFPLVWPFAFTSAERISVAPFV